MEEQQQKPGTDQQDTDPRFIYYRPASPYWQANCYMVYRVSDDYCMGIARAVRGGWEPRYSWEPWAGWQSSPSFEYCVTIPGRPTPAPVFATRDECAAHMLQVVTR